MKKNIGRDINCEIERQKSNRRKKDGAFTGIDPSKGGFDVYIELSKIQYHITDSNKELAEESTKKYLIDEISRRLLRLEFKSNNSKKTSLLKGIVKHLSPTLLQK